MSGRRSSPGCHSFLGVDFRGNAEARVEGSVHVQLADFIFKPGEKKEALLNIGFLKPKPTIGQSTTLEEFLAYVIKDKPVNIDLYFDSFVRPVFRAGLQLQAFLQQAIGNLDPEKVAGLAVNLDHQASLASVPSQFSPDFKNFAKSKVEGSQAQTDIDDSNLRESKIR